MKNCIDGDKSNCWTPSEISESDSANREKELTKIVKQITVVDRMIYYMFLTGVYNGPHYDTYSIVTQTDSNHNGLTVSILYSH